MHNHILLFLNIGTSEMILIVLAALLLFGGEKLPEMARGLGKGLRDFKDASDGIKREIQRNIDSVNDEVTGIDYDSNYTNYDSDTTQFDSTPTDDAPQPTIEETASNVEEVAPRKSTQRKKKRNTKN